MTDFKTKTKSEYITKMIQSLHFLQGDVLYSFGMRNPKRTEIITMNQIGQF